MFEYLKKRKKLLFISLLFFLIQLPFLDQLSLLRGERDIVLTAWSLARTGRDLYGRFMPLEFTGIDPNVPFVPMYITALWWLIVPLKSVFSARLFFILISTTIPFLVFEIVNSIKKEQRIAYFTAILFCFSPGIFYLTRLTLEIGIALPLLLAGILTYLKHRKKVSLFFFFLAFFSYHGFRPLIPILLIYLEFFYHINGKGKGIFKNLLLIVIFSITLLALSLKIDGNLMKSRSNDLIFFNFIQLADQINYRRNTSSAPLAIAALFDNKLTDLGMFIKDNFFGGISFEYLFRNGDPSSLYATTFSGQFFLTYIILFLLGFAYMGKKGTKYDLYILGLILVGMVPSLSNISYPSYSIRSILSSVGYSYLFGLGLLFLIDGFATKQKHIKVLFLSVMGLVLLVEIIYLSYNFYFRRFITMSQMYFETERRLPLYLSENSTPYTIYVSSPRDMFFGYVFFNNKIDPIKVQETMKKGEPYIYDDVMIKKCSKTFSPHNTIVSDMCLDELTYTKLINLKTKKIDYTNYSFKSAFFILD